ncbi:MAG: riboflavin synthase [Odoribacteraceae bacterium]|jgi:riboflavin synthase|nr:riboflavin synthase [Odoribacteraceae bacterium]
MFTGIIEEVGRIKRVDRGHRAIVLEVVARRVLEGLRVGDSIATNGVCLTVTSFDGSSFRADVMPETARASNLGEVRAGDPVNLERALAFGDRLGGHLVSGHVDGTGKIVAKEREENAGWVTIAAGEELLRYVIKKGSVAVDGISLTVAAVAERSFKVSVIPHTRRETTLAIKEVGATVNVENDLVAKYVERLARLPVSPPSTRAGGLTLDDLMEHGF